MKMMPELNSPLVVDRIGWRERFCAVDIESIVIDQDNPTGRLFLKSIDLPRQWSLPVGIVELNIIVNLISNRSFQRPPTHYACLSIINELGGKLIAGHINSINRTIAPAVVHASLHINHERGQIAIDVRPSDMLALVVAAGCPIYLHAGVLD